VPNALFVMFQTMPEAALRCVLQIARQTFGFHRESAECSLSYLQMTTGMGRQGVINGTKWLMDNGVAERVRVGQTFTYRVLVHQVDQSDQPEQSTKWTSASPLSGPELVHQVDTRKKDLKKQVKKGSTGASAPPAETPLNRLLFSAIAEVCLMDSSAKSNAARIGKCAGWLAKKDGIKCEHVHQFGAWYAANDWRGRDKGERPTPEFMMSEWAKFAAGYKPKQGKGRTFQRGQAMYTPEVRAAKEREAALALERGEE
jgi:hypothetical protein